MTRSQQYLSGTKLRLLSYNIQVGIKSNRPHHYLTRSWKHLFPHGEHFHTLDNIAHLIRDHDLIALQEVDAGSLRSSFVNQTQYLAQRAGFEHWYHQTNRNIGHIARHSNGLLSRYQALAVYHHKLPGRMPGRGAMVAEYGDPDNPLTVVMLHLALSRRARMLQLNYVADLIEHREHAVVMGDLNCQPEDPELQLLLERTGLYAPASSNTFPSWRPRRKLDHILVSPSLMIENVQVLDADYSDHLPISMEVVVPEAVRFVA